VESSSPTGEIESDSLVMLVDMIGTYSIFITESSKNDPGQVASTYETFKLFKIINLEAAANNSS
jgi:hypothetical protein